MVTNRFGCKDTLNDYLQITDEFAFFAPNAFSPNGDGKNDFFAPVIYGVLKYRLRIYDRAGFVVFESEEPGETWNGEVSKRMPAQIDQYTYQVDAIDYLGNNRLFIGNLQVIR